MHKFINLLPKTELHLHIEGSFEPELMFKIAKRNHIKLPYSSLQEVKAAYKFTNLQDFLDIYMSAVQVLQTEKDFYDLTYAYLEKVHADNVVHVEIFFAPQLHTDRGIHMATVVNGITKALDDGAKNFGITYRLIACFLRHLSADAAMDTLDELLKYKKVIGVGLESSEKGHPPEKFVEVFAKARANNLRVVAHAGEEGPPEYIWQAINLLKVERIEHGVRALEDKNLIKHLVQSQIPLTVCPLSNIKLCVFENMEQHNLPKLLTAGVLVTINSDDPAYFGGYVSANYSAIYDALHLSKAEIITLVKNGFKASFLSDSDKERWFKKIDDLALKIDVPLM